MTKQLWLIFCAVTLALTLPACSEVSNCKVGEAGCIVAPCKGDSDCTLGLTCESVEIKGVSFNVCGERSGKAVQVGCKAGDTGCFGGACKSGGSCNDGLVCRGDICALKCQGGDPGCFGG